jgi:hypothetical protein
MNITHKNYPNVKQYVSQWKAVISLSESNPDARIKVSWKSEMSAKECRGWFLKALSNRINSRGGIYFNTKKQDYDYEVSLHRDQNRIRDWYSKRIIIHSFETKVCKQRFSHLIWND